jgi:hypothetical protein
MDHNLKLIKSHLRDGKTPNYDFKILMHFIGLEFKKIADIKIDDNNEEMQRIQAI